MTPRIAIIGGGFAGLTAAYRLKQAGVHVTIFEALGDLGGLASGFKLAGYPVEKACHFLRKTDKHILALVDELGLRERLSFHASSVSTYRDGVLYPMMSPVDLMKFTPISFLNRIRAGLTVLHLQRTKKWRKLNNITALEWLRKHAGRQATEVIWEPLLRGKFDRFHDRVAMSWLWGRLKQRDASYNARLGGEALGYLEGGFEVIVQELVRRLGGRVDIRLKTRVSDIRHDGKEVIVTTPHGKERFDRVLATVPSNILAGMIASYENQAPQYFKKLRSTDYVDACVQVFATPQKLTPYHWHSINTPNAPFAVFQNLTNLVGSERFNGLNIYYIGDYALSDHANMVMDPTALKTHWYDQLNTIFPQFDRTQIVDDGLFRLRNAQHVVDVRFEENKLPPYYTPCPRLLLCNSAQSYPIDRRTDYAVCDGDAMARAILTRLKQDERSPKVMAHPPLAAVA